LTGQSKFINKELELNKLIKLIRIN